MAQLAGFSSNGLNIIVSGTDPAQVAAATTTVMDSISGNTDLNNLSSDLATATPEIQVKVDPEQGRRGWFHGSADRR